MGSVGMSGTHVGRLPGLHGVPPQCLDSLESSIKLPRLFPTNMSPLINCADVPFRVHARGSSATLRCYWRLSYGAQGALGTFLRLLAGKHRSVLCFSANTACRRCGCHLGGRVSANREERSVIFTAKQKAFKISRLELWRKVEGLW